MIQWAREQPGSPACPASCTKHPHTTAYNTFPTDLGGSSHPHQTKKLRFREKRGRIQVTKLEGGWNSENRSPETLHQPFPQTRSKPASVPARPQCNAGTRPRHHPLRAHTCSLSLLTIDQRMRCCLWICRISSELCKNFRLGDIRMTGPGSYYLQVTKLYFILKTTSFKTLSCSQLLMFFIGANAAPRPLQFQGLESRYPLGKSKFLTPPVSAWGPGGSPGGHGQMLEIGLFQTGPGITVATAGPSRVHPSSIS